ncbi:hypothetical protein LTR22_014575 [Elasticomyces elasticus]|nr:hypothetical protein LTR22_014575 [Elasticomyces elasticus]
MNPHGRNRTPSENPALNGSPAINIGRLSLEYDEQRSATPQGHDQGRVTRRAASSDFPREQFVGNSQLTERTVHRGRLACPRVYQEALPGDRQDVALMPKQLTFKGKMLNTTNVPFYMRLCPWPIGNEWTSGTPHDNSVVREFEPGCSPFSEDQLTVDIKGIYAGLVIVEAKCISLDAAQASNSAELEKSQWQALIALHRILLYEHHDFLMATQHPSPTAALKALPTKYSMPARMWKHGIHAFLEVLRHRRPSSEDYMLFFINLAYQMMALPYETTPIFLDTWIECLGALARYRMAIEEEKEPYAQWGYVAASWYIKASDRHL